MSYRGCKSGISTSDFDEFLLPKFSQRKSITPSSIFAVKRLINVPYMKSFVGLKLDIQTRMHKEPVNRKKMSQQQEREVRWKSNIAKIAITASEGPYAFWAADPKGTMS